MAAGRTMGARESLGPRLGLPCLAVLDFDGTLAPIAPTPGEARMEPRMKALLRRLAATGSVRVAVISGRGLGDLADKVGVRGVVCVGNHGLTCTHRGLGFEGGPAAGWRRTCRRTVRLLSPLEKGFPGCVIESKGVDASLHYRLVPPRLVAGLKAEARSLVAGLPLRFSQGKKVLEFRPLTGRNKGWALKRLARRLAPGWRRTGTCIFMGDDRTDEDAFRAVREMGPRAVGIKVGPGRTAATLRVDGQRKVPGILGFLGERLERIGKGNRRMK